MGSRRYLFFVIAVFRRVLECLLIIRRQNRLKVKFGELSDSILAARFKYRFQND